MAIPRPRRPQSTSPKYGYRHEIKVHSRSRTTTRGWLRVGSLLLPAALGSSGCSTIKREGDGATPIGRWRLVKVFYRQDRLFRPRTALPIRPLRPHDGWCDAVGDRNYNRFVSHPYPASAERLWRCDEVYDVIVVLDHNARPRVQGGGSAIFMHLARPGYTPTAGCIALSRRDLLLLLAEVGRRAWISVG
jgi:L,D-peptidoglycan transpeptidase YkuD (ErfK/YbiS/YcfS/YnhG family)